MKNGLKQNVSSEIKPVEFKICSINIIINEPDKKHDGIDLVHS